MSFPLCDLLTAYFITLDHHDHSSSPIQSCHLATRPSVTMTL